MRSRSTCRGHMGVAVRAPGAGQRDRRRRRDQAVAAGHAGRAPRRARGGKARGGDPRFHSAAPRRAAGGEIAGPVPGSQLDRGPVRARPSPARQCEPADQDQASLLPAHPRPRCWCSRAAPGALTRPVHAGHPGGAESPRLTPPESPRLTPALFQAATLGHPWSYCRHDQAHGRRGGHLPPAVIALLAAISCSGRPRWLARSC